MKTFFGQAFPDTRAFEGCLQVTVNIGENGRNFALIGVWASREGYQRAFAWRQTRKPETEALLGMLDGLPSTRHFDVLDI